ncbi:hypothetical protein C8F04DRAFT_1243995 [Mycena alexandri]|uniref:Uncharacterized protein n=1 Tax=Mycena alexandri TaxID=1745969 RepID=A0AAD6S285_9AGAR|nr:hypothetical protein C8F04DRAFT_1243995 [Mycena alexandri]
MKRLDMVGFPRLRRAAALLRSVVSSLLARLRRLLGRQIGRRFLGCAASSRGAVQPSGWPGVRVDFIRVRDMEASSSDVRSVLCMRRSFGGGGVRVAHCSDIFALQNLGSETPVNAPSRPLTRARYSATRYCRAGDSGLSGGAVGARRALAQTARPLFLAATSPGRVCSILSHPVTLGNNKGAIHFCRRARMRDTALYVNLTGPRYLGVSFFQRNSSSESLSKTGTILPSAYGDSTPISPTPWVNGRQRDQIRIQLIPLQPALQLLNAKSIHRLNTSWHALERQTIQGNILSIRDEPMTR